MLRQSASWDARPSTQARWFTQLCAGAAFGIAMLAAAGWLFDVGFLAGQWGGAIPMAPSAALAFLFLSGGVFCQARWSSQRLSGSFVLAAACLPALLGLLVLTQFVLGFDSGVERTLARTGELVGQIPLGRMSPLTAVAFLLESGALILSLRAARWRFSASGAALLALAAATMNGLVLVGYFYGAPLLYGGATIPVAMPTALAFVVLGTGQIRLVLHGVPALRAWSGDSTRGILLRAFLPTMLLFLLTEHRLVALPITFLSPALLHSLTALVGCFLIVVIIGWTARRTGEAIERSQEALRASREILQAVLNSIPVRVFWKDRNLVYLGCNTPFARDAGFEKPEDIIGKDDHATSWREQAEIYRADDRAVIEGGIARLLFEEPQTTPSGERIHLLTSKLPLRDADGEIVGVLGTYYDITDRKRAEDALRESEATVRKKLEAILEPEGDIGELNLADIIDREALQAMMEDFYRLTNISSAVLDISGTVLVTAGWQDICTQFHRVHPDILKNCQESDVMLTNGVPAGTFKAYQCKNNLWDVVTPIEVGGKHLGNIYVGQFFYEDEIPDLELFRIQAQKCGFEEAEYLAAVDRIPRWSRGTVDAAMAFYAKLAGMISSLGYGQVKLSRALSQKDQALRQLRESALQFRTVLETVSLVGVVLDSEGNITLCNDFLLALTGWKRDEVLHHSWFELFLPPEIRREIAEVLFPKIADTGEFPVHYQNEILTRKGERRLVQWNNTIIRGPGGQLVGVASIGEDITERKLAEEALRESEERLRRAVLQAPFPLILHAEDGEVLMISDTWTEITGYSHSDIRTIGDWTERAYGQRKELVREDINRLYGLNRKDSEGEYEIQTKCGERRTWEFMSAPLGALPDGRRLVMSMAMDVTERKLLEASLAQAQKMESIGRLAGGVAHDFNNLLTVINGYSQLMLRDLGVGDPMRSTLNQVLRAGERAAGLTQQLLAFSRKQVLKPRRLDLNHVVEEMRPMLRRLLGEDVEVCVKLHPEAAITFADPHQLEQVVMNLVVNARDAMPGGGKLLIETVRLELDESYTRSHPEARAGRYVKLAVSDSGVGMDAETRQRIFEPFFTTKGVGKGTGLGLSMVQGIVAQSGGHIEVNSEPGQGATFKIYLPAAAEAEADAGRPAEVPALGGKETVLVVEDQAEVRDYAVTVLKTYGYRVIPAENAGEALLLCKRDGEHIDLVLTDVVMPNISGRELANGLEKLQPGIKVLFMSGYTDDAIAHHGVLDEGANFIQKPFSPEALVGKVRAVLGPPAQMPR